MSVYPYKMSLYSYASFSGTSYLCQKCGLDLHIKGNTMKSKEEFKGNIAIITSSKEQAIPLKLFLISQLKIANNQNNWLG